MQKGGNERVSSLGPQSVRYGQLRSLRHGSHLPLQLSKKVMHLALRGFEVQRRGQLALGIAPSPSEGHPQTTRDAKRGKNQVALITATLAEQPQRKSSV